MILLHGQMKMELGLKIKQRNQTFIKIEMNKLQRKEKLIQSIKENKGLLTLAAAKAGVKYWTLWKYSKEFPEIREAVDEAKESMLDFAEGKLYQAISEGNMTAIIFFLKTKGKSRGFIERAELTGAEGMPLININVNSDLTKTNITDVIARLSSN